MTLPNELNVLDRHNGFTAVTKSPKLEREGNGWVRRWRESDTLWRPGAVLKRGTIGKLDETVCPTFYQCNNNVTMGHYKVPGYQYRVAVWFDNETGERIA